MNEDGLISVEYSPKGRIAVFIYKRGHKYDIKELLAYVAIMSEGKAKRVLVYEGPALRKHDMVWEGERWLDMAD